MTFRPDTDRSRWLRRASQVILLPQTRHRHRQRCNLEFGWEHDSWDFKFRRNTPPKFGFKTVVFESNFKNRYWQRGLLYICSNTDTDKTDGCVTHLRIYILLLRLCTEPTSLKQKYHKSFEPEMNVKGKVPQFVFFRSNLIYWIVMGCVFAFFGQRGQ